MTWSQHVTQPTNAIINDAVYLSINGVEYLSGARYFDKVDDVNYSIDMGRPPLHMQDIKIRLSPETRERIKALVGNYRIAAFIREAIENELARREAEQENE